MFVGGEEEVVQRDCCAHRRIRTPPALPANLDPNIPVVDFKPVGAVQKTGIKRSGMGCMGRSGMGCMGSVGYEKVLGPGGHGKR